jgi:hypothetical protein
MLSFTWILSIQRFMINVYTTWTIIFFMYFEIIKSRKEPRGKMMLTSSIEVHIVKHNFLVLPSSTKNQNHNYF